jgi:hypothetical protein
MNKSKLDPIKILYYIVMVVIYLLLLAALEIILWWAAHLFGIMGYYPDYGMVWV